jgi:hypothetical protein
MGKGEICDFGDDYPFVRVGVERFSRVFLVAIIGYEGPSKRRTQKLQANATQPDFSSQ